MSLPTFNLADIDVAKQRLDLSRADCEESLYEFYKAAWPYIDPAPWKDGWAIDAIAEHLQAVCDGQIRRLIINISPRCSKSNLVSVAFDAWVWAQPRNGPISGPNVPFLHASYANQLSLRDSVKCRRLIESPWYQERWGDRFKLTSDQNTKSRFTNDRGGERLITSIDGTNTGEGGMCFVAGTQVSTPDGKVTIEKLKVGDRVMAFDVKQGKVVESKVLATAHRETNWLVEIREISGGRILCTRNHPVYSPGRGFVRADQMGPGDWLLIKNKIGETGENLNSPVMRFLREEDRQKFIQGEESVEARESGQLLQQDVLFRASRNQEFATLPLVPENSIKTPRQVLFGRLQRKSKKQTHERSAFAKTKKVLRFMREKILWSWNCLLFSKMCQQSAFVKNDWCRKFKISWIGKIFKSVFGNASCNHGKRWLQVRGLRCDGNNSRGKNKEVFSSNSSYQRKHSGQSPREFNHVVHSMPPKTSQWRIGQIASVTHHRAGPIKVYDIQVERQSNFFAENILVHNCIVIDDPNSVDDVDSEATIQTAIDWWTGTMPTRLNDQKTGAYIIIQQRTFENDLTGHILETEGDDWCHLMIPMRYEAERSYVLPTGWKDPRTVEGQLMWPERFAEAEVSRLEKRLGPYRAAGQLQQRPEPAGGGIIKREWWKLWERDTFPPMDFIMGCLDTAYTEDTMNDPSGMIVWGIFSGDTKAQQTRMIDADGRPIYLDRTYSEGAPGAMLMHAWDDHLELHDLVQKVAKTAVALKIDVLVIENKASGISVAQEIRRLYSNEKFSVQLFDPKSQDKTARLYSIQHLFSEGMVWAPDRKWAEKVITQVGQFPKGKHDEFVDLTSMGLRKLREMGLLTRAPERQAELEELKVYSNRQTQPLYPV